MLRELPFFRRSEKFLQKFSLRKCLSVRHDSAHFFGTNIACEALQNRNALPLDVLLRLEQFTSAEQMPAFYGQCESLIRFFSLRGDLNKVTRFGVDAKRHGCDAALRKHYQIGGIGELERLWKAFAYNNDSGRENAAILAVSYRP